MWISKFALVGCALAVFASSAQAAADKIVGVVASINADSLQVTTKIGTTQSVRLDGKTGYVKLITHQPWQQDSWADRTFLHVGRCVTIQVRRDDTGVAKLIRINTDEAGTIWNPCRH